MKNFSILVICFLLAFSACGSDGDDDDKTYKIGDTGPGGGIVFYVSDKGFDFYTGNTADDNSKQTCHYLETAPKSTEWTSTAWGPLDKLVSGTETDIGHGRRNTKIIVAFLKVEGESGTAAQLCNALDYGGYKDWFLPSKDELELIYENLYKKGFGDFADGSVAYWSSSEDDSYNAWGQDFDDGAQYGSGKTNAGQVRAVRAF